MASESNIHKLFFTFDLYRGMQENRLEYIYRGPFTEKVVESLMLLAESNLRDDKSDLATRKKLYFLMVESLQNITRHQHVHPQAREIPQTASERSGIFIVRKAQNRYLLTTGNLIHHQEIEKLRNHIDTVNSLGTEALKREYRQVLDMGEISAKGGAGLGLIGMARKSGNKLDYSFRPIDQEHSYFYLNLALDELVPSDTDEVCTPSSYFENIATIHDILNREHILLNYCGSFTEATFDNLREIVASQVPQIHVRERVLAVMGELISNAARFGRSLHENNDKVSGILIFSVCNNRYHIATGNYLSKHKIPYFEQQMELSRSLFQTAYQPLMPLTQPIEIPLPSDLPASVLPASATLTPLEINPIILEPIHLPEKTTNELTKESTDESTIHSPPPHGSDSLMRIQLASGNSINWEVNDFTPDYSFVAVEAIVE